MHRVRWRSSDVIHPQLSTTCRRLEKVDMLDVRRYNKCILECGNQVRLNYPAVKQGGCRKGLCMGLTVLLKDPH